MKTATVDVQTSYNRNRSRHKRDNVFLERNGRYVLYKA